MVHHILVYECSDDFPKHLLNYTGRCYTSNMPPQIRECAGLLTIAGWAIGGKVSSYIMMLISRDGWQTDRY